MKLEFSRRSYAIVLLALLASVCMPLTVSAATAGEVQKKIPFAQSIQAQVTGVLEEVQNGGDYAKAISTLGGLFDQAILFSPDDRLDAIRDADFALRLITQLDKVPAAVRGELLPFLRKNPGLASTLVFLIRADRDKPASIYALLDQLRQKRGDQLEKYATLTAAICVVHDRPLQRRINENAVKATTALDIFDYFVKNESRMFFGIKNVPAELLVYVVDTTASLDEMNWAMGKYAGDREVGKRFFDIKYDYEAFKTGKTKEVTTKGFNLQNILHYGGVCADQAYFAVSVGKAIGVPTAYTTGASGEAGHAWVGFLQANKASGWWNFNSGRYEAYQGVRGNVQDPQTRENIPDSYVSLLGEMIGTKAVDRQNAVALTDAAHRLIDSESSAMSTVAAPVAADYSTGSIRTKPRKTDLAAQLGLIELALHQSAAYAPAWFTVRDLAVAKKLAVGDKKHWADLLIRLGAQKYPDFTLAMLTPMVQTIEDAKEQDAIWNNVLPLFQRRLDLAASIRMEQANLWESNNKTDRAGLCYMDIIEHYANGGPFVLPALAGAEKLLKASSRADKVVVLYEQTWSRTKQPQEMAQQFLTQSNWYRVGKLYAQKLTEAGNSAKALEVETKIAGGGKAAAK